MTARSNNAITQRIQRAFSRDFPLHRGLLSAALQSIDCETVAKNNKRPEATAKHQRLYPERREELCGISVTGTIFSIS
jgi:hypothetical protein